MNQDTLFLDDTLSQFPFEFTEKVATVFDDMISRSVPCYTDILKLISAIIFQSVPHHGHVYDLGCSTGNTIKALLALVDKKMTIEGIDLSAPMLARAQKKLSDAEKKHVTLTQHDLNTPILLKPADAIILNLTLQFLQRDARHALLTECYRSLQQRGVVLVIEKVCGQDDAETHTLSTRYEFYKQLNGYSLKEIENKKKALDHILNPLSIDENEHLFREAGFKTINQQFRWVNFVGWELQK